MNASNIPDAMMPPALKTLLDSQATSAARANAGNAEHAAVLAALTVSYTGRPAIVVAPTSTFVERISGLTRFLLENGPVPCDFPRWPVVDTSPWEPVIESPFISATRLGALATCSLAEDVFVLVMDASAAARKVMPFESFCEGIGRIQVGRELEIDSIAAMLAGAGYRRTSTVAEVGEYAVRNSVLDIYSPMHDDPFRIEVDFDAVESVRFFDPATQRTRRNADHAWIVPVWEVPSSPSSLREAGIRIRDAAAEQGIPSAHIQGIENQIAEGRAPAGFAGMLPFFHEALDLPIDYAGEDVAVIVVDPDGCAAAADAELERLRGLYSSIPGRVRGRRSGQRNKSAVDPDSNLAAPAESLTCTGSELITRLESRPGTLLLSLEAGGGILGAQHHEVFSREMVLATASEAPVSERVTALRTLSVRVVEEGGGLLVLAPSEGEARRVRQILEAEGLEPQQAPGNGMTALMKAGHSVQTAVGRCRVPFGIEMFGVVAVPSEAVFGVKDIGGRRRQERRNVQKIQEFRELAPGDMVIHRDHGLGLFEKMVDVEVDGIVSECLLLSYRAGDRLYVPVDRAHLLDRYSPPTEGETRPLDSLGSPTWQKRRSAARGAARDIAAKLRALYARRLSATAPTMSPPDNEFREFEAAFQWETTPDQEKAVEEILDDLQKTSPVDRLICGDVGFGKTEVAMRAAYKAVLDGYQVAVLVPTTILAEQHRLTFAARMRNTPVVVESISRFKSSSEMKESLQRLRTGAVDVMIGTHRLLSSDVKFQNLGLLIIDEEHRFGVVHKERLREMSIGVHTLTLTATPIPRTLHMALSGIRELSLITTPPRDRLAVRTFVARSGMEIIRSAILREKSRGGQVFIVHNRVHDIFDFARQVSSVVPEVKIAVGHGQMSASELEGVMSSFVRGESDVLVATTIIESGLDIGTANTMLIHDADMLGLAQLYQLRGRVGRSTEQAYCYLLVRDPGLLKGEARMRIEAIERFSELASGFNLASMDLAIRGGGDILGAEQSGHMAAVGEEMFLEMLSDAIRELSGESVDETPDPEVKLDTEVRIPADYVPEERVRLRFYKRMAGASERADLDYIASELVDRFGAPPAPAANLIAMMKIRIAAASRGLSSVSIRSDDVILVSAPGRAADVQAVMTRFAAAGWSVIGGQGSGPVRMRMAGFGFRPGPERLDDVARLIGAFD